MDLGHVSTCFRIVSNNIVLLQQFLDKSQHVLESYQNPSDNSNRFKTRLKMFQNRLPKVPPNPFQNQLKIDPGPPWSPGSIMMMILC